MFGLLDFQSYSLWLNLVIFAIAAAAVWYAGSKLSGYADKISKKTGMGKAFIGLILLAAATSLPEVASTATAGLANNAPLAVSNLMGSLVVNMVILAIVDLAISDGPLTFFVPQPVILLEGICLTGLIALAIAGMAVGEFLVVWNVGMWTVLILVVYLFSLYMVHVTEKRENWYSPPTDSEKKKNENQQKKSGEQQSKQQELREKQSKESSQRQSSDKQSKSAPGQSSENKDSSEDEEEKSSKDEKSKDETSKVSLTKLLLYFAGASAVILFAGVALAQIAPVLATQTGLGTGLVGTALLALSTSLPELSTTLSAVRMKNYSMAFSNLLGSSAFGIMILLVADLFYRQGPVLQAVDRSAILPAAMGIVATVVYMVGMIDRRNRTLLRMGYDSIMVLGLYAATLVGLYFLT